MTVIQGHYALRFKTRSSFGAHHENLNEDSNRETDLYFHRWRCSPMILVSGNIRFMPIFEGVPRSRGVKQQWGNRKHGFSPFHGFRCYVFSALRNEANVIVYHFNPLSPFHWPQNIWPWMTLNGLNSHYTLNFHYCDLPLSNYFLLINCRVCLRM